MLTRKRKREIEYQDSAQRALRLVRSFQFVSPARRRWNILRNVMKRLQILRYWAGARSVYNFRLPTDNSTTLISPLSNNKYFWAFENLLTWDYRLEGNETMRYPRLALNMRPIRGAPPTGRGIARLMPLP